MLTTIFEQTQTAAATDLELLRRYARLHDEEAFRQLLDRHDPMVMGVCLRILKNRHDAEEVVQETFLMLAASASWINPRSTLAAYVYGTARYKAMKRAHQLLLRQAKERQALQTVASECRTEQALLLEHLDREIESLPRRWRELIIRCELEGQTQRSVATEMNLPHGTVSGQLRQAKQRLAERLGRVLNMSSASVAALLAESSLTAAPGDEALQLVMRHATIGRSAWLYGSAMVSFWWRTLMPAVIVLSLVAVCWVGVKLWPEPEVRPRASMAEIHPEPPLIVVHKNLLEWSVEYNRRAPVWDIVTSEKTKQLVQRLVPGRSIWVLPDVVVQTGDKTARLGMVYSSANHATFLPEQMLRGLTLKKLRRVDLAKEDPQCLALLGLSLLNSHGQTVFDVVQLDRAELGLGPAIDGPLEAYVLEKATLDVGYFGSTWARRASRDGYSLIHSAAANAMYYGNISKAGHMKLAPTDLLRKRP